MAALPDAERKAVWAKLMSDISAEGEAFGALTKADLRAAVDALDDFLVTNAAAINSAIPQPARAQLTVAQKARLLSAVVLRRYTTGA